MNTTPLLRFVLALITICIFHSMQVRAQHPDTSFIGNKVFISNKGLQVFNLSQWNALQQEKKQRTALTANNRQVVADRIFSSNSCGVTASFSPGNDSVQNGSLALGPFTNTSTNASSVTWYMNGFMVSNNNTVNFGGVPPGIYEIKLAAKNGVCTDTAVCYYYITGTQPADRNNIKAYYGTPMDEHLTAFTAVPGGGYLLGGYGYSTIYGGYAKGMLIKLAESGCVEWSKKIQSTYDGEIYQVIALKNGGYAISGYNDNTAYLMRLDASGSTIWTKVYYLAGKLVHPQLVTETDNGGFVMAGTAPAGLFVWRTDATGNMLWNKQYTMPSSLQTYYSPACVMQQGPDVYITGGIFKTDIFSNNVSTKLYGFVQKMNDADGGLQWNREYAIAGNDCYVRDIHAYGGNLLVNSNGSMLPNANNTFHVLDNAGNILSSNTVTTPTTSYGLERSTLQPLPNGDLYLLNTGTETLALQPGYAYHSIFIKLDAGLNPVWAKTYGHYGGGRFYFPAIGQNATFAGAGDEIGTVLDPYRSFSYKMQFKKFDAGGNLGAANFSCNFYDQPVSIIPQPSSSKPFAWTTENSVAGTVTDTVLGVNTIYAQARYQCPDFVDSCNFLKLTGADAVCDLSAGYTYRVHRNNACNEPVKWELPPGASLINQTDSTVTLQFAVYGNYRVAASLPFACSPIKDSLLVIAQSRSGVLNLGRDTVICPNSSIKLHAGNKFLAYQWQDGSKDSVLTVSSTGTFSIEVIDSCGTILRDTVVIGAPANITVDAGPDLEKCNADSLTLTVPAGYLSYGWTPNVYMKAISSRQVIVYPPTDTAYVIKAEKMAGCFAYDTVHIKVNHSPVIRLGADTSLCTGDSLWLNAGAGFSQYQWNTNVVAQQISVRAKGMYTVTATDANGCISKDTLNIRNIYDLPAVASTHDSSICKNGPKLLELAAVQGNTYLWSNGGVTNSIRISDTGRYSVSITDKNGCKNKDQFIINTILPLPANFFAYADTAICTYGTLVLATPIRFSSYQWNTNASTETVTISKPGTYWLQVTDKNGCPGKDSILVKQKDCMEGFYMPNAFTPTKATNNLLKPLLFGNVQEYEFIIYNRWGQPVFRSTEPGKGWDGKYRGKPEDNNVFVWSCTYRLQGKDTQMEKGTVLLIR